MKCSRCRHDIPPGASFCAACGASVVVACSNCGKQVTPTARFCPECGQPIAASLASPSQFATHQADTSAHLAEKILLSKTALAGERKQVTVLFADLKASMELLANRDPEEARAILDPVLERMIEAVHRYEGTVNQVMGDGIMALFGAPIAAEDHAVRACYSALQMQESIKQYAKDVGRPESLPIEIRAGLNSGEVVVRAIGSDLHMDYSAVGQTTHLASRLEQMATPGTVLISANTLQLAEGYVVVKALGPRSVKGLERPLDVYELVGAAPMRSRFHTVAARGLTRFVGREAELDILQRALDQASRGHGQIVAVVGEPGVGKSRLCREFTRSHRAHGWRVIESGSLSFGKSANYSPVLELLRAYFDIDSHDDARAIRHKVTEKLLALDRALEPVLAPLLWIFDVPFEDPTWEHLDPPQRGQRILDGLKRLLLRESRAQPLIIVFEDLHWIDAETEAFLDSLVESLPSARLLLIVNYRPEYQHAWSSKASYQQLRIDPLPAESADQLLETLMGSADELRPLKQLLIERTEGNPLFLEESVRTLVETKALVGERRAYRLGTQATGFGQALQIPASLQALLAARIDRLSPEHKYVLQAASVIGTDVPLRLLQFVADQGADLSRALAQLVTAEFLYETHLFPELHYTFAHALTHEVAYGSLLHEHRRAMHARLVDAIEQLYPERLDEHVERLAHHAVRGERWAKAVSYLRQSGTKAYMRSANREATALLEQSLMALARLAETRDTMEKAIDIRFDLRNALQPLGDLNRIITCLKEAEALAMRLGDERRLGWVASYLTEHYRMLGETDLAAAAGRRALDIGERLEDFAMQVVTNLPLGLLYRALGSYRRAIECLSWNIARLDGDLLHERFGLFGLASVFSRTFSVMCLAELGEFEQGTVQAEESIRIAEAVDEPFSRVYAYMGLGALHLRKGDFPRAIPMLRDSVAVAQSSHIPVGFVYAASLFGYALTLSGGPAEGLPFLEQAIERSAAMKLIAGHSATLAYLAEAYLLSGRIADAARASEDALQRALQHKERGYEAYARRAAAEVAAARDDLPAATAQYLKSLGLAEELEMRPLLAHCHWGLGRILDRAGDSADAEAHLRAASALFSEMGMKYWGQRLAAARAQAD